VTITAESAVAAEADRRFVAEDAGGHGEQRYQITLTAIGDKQRMAAVVRDHEGPERHDPGAHAVELEAVRAVAEHVAHGGAVAQHGTEIEQLSVRGRWLVGRHQQAGGDHRERPEPGQHKGRTPADPSAITCAARNDSPTPKE
jgi:hypothetical protein